MTDGTQPIETGNVPASAVGGQPFGGNEGGLTERPGQPGGSADANPDGAAGRPVTAGENSSGQGANQEARQNGPETGQKDGKEAAARQSEAHQKIAKQAEEGIQSAQSGKSDGAREALQEIANSQQEALLILFTDFATPMVRGKVIEVFRALVKGKGEEERKALQEKFSSFLEEIGAKETDKRFSKLITELKDSFDLASSALGYDLEIAMKRERVRQIDEYLRENPNASDRQQQEEERNRLASEIEALKKERNGQIEVPQNASEEERKKIEEQNKKGQERAQKFPQDQVEAQLRPLVGKIAEVAGLSEEQRKKLEGKDCLSAMTEIFGGVIDRCIKVGEKGISIQPKALKDFTQGLLNSGLINKDGAGEINKLAENLEELNEGVNKLLRELMLKEGGKKGLTILLGIFGVLAVLGYIAAQKERGDGGRHMM
jgi:hypothetical protein